MKKIILSLFFAGILLTSIQAQITVILQGTVTDSVGPVAGIAVHIDSLRTSPGGQIPSFPYQNTVYTDANGFYADTLTVPLSNPVGAVVVFIVDCKGDTIMALGVWGNGQGTFFPIVNNFNYCPASTGSGGTYGLRGLVITGNSMADLARVYLIEYDSTAGVLYAVDSMDQGSGVQGYWFNNLNPQNTYFVKAALLPGSLVYANYLPTYFDTVFWWYNAIPLTPALMNPIGPSFDIYMVAGNNPGGPGFIGGLVSQGANKTNGPGDPIANASVLLLTDQDRPVTHTVTNQLGEFSFNGVAYGNYKVYVEIAGKYCLPHYVTLDAQNDAATGLQFKVQTSTITTGIFSPGNTSPNDIHLYPNPISSGQNLMIDLGGQQVESAALWNPEGKQIANWHGEDFAGQKITELDPGELSPGIYFLIVKKSTGDLSIIKIIKN